MQVHVLAAEGQILPQDLFLSFRYGLNQKQKRFTERNTFRFADLSASVKGGNVGHIELYRRIGTASVDFTEFSNGDLRDVYVPCGDVDLPYMQLRVALGEEGIPLDVKPKAPKEQKLRQRMEEAQKYMTDFQLNDLLSETLRDVIREKPRNPHQYISNEILRKGGRLPPLDLSRKEKKGRVIVPPLVLPAVAEETEESVREFSVELSSSGTRRSVETPLPETSVVIGSRVWTLTPNLPSFLITKENRTANCSVVNERTEAAKRHNGETPRSDSQPPETPREGMIVDGSQLTEDTGPADDPLVKEAPNTEMPAVEIQPAEAAKPAEEPRAQKSPSEAKPIVQPIEEATPLEEPRVEEATVSPIGEKPTLESQPAEEPLAEKPPKEEKIEDEPQSAEDAKAADDPLVEEALKPERPSAEVQAPDAATPTEETRAQESPNKGTAVVESAEESTPVEQTQVGDALREEKPVVEPRPTKEAKPADEPQTVDTFHENVPVDKSQPPTEDQMVEVLEAAKSPVGEKPTDEPQPAEEPLAENAPKVEHIVDEPQPAEDAKPADDALLEEAVKAETPAAEEQPADSANPLANSAGELRAQESPNEAKPLAEPALEAKLVEEPQVEEALREAEVDDEPQPAETPKEEEPAAEPVPAEEAKLTEELMSVDWSQPRTDALPAFELPTPQSRNEQIVDESQSGKAAKPIDEPQEKKAPEESPNEEKPVFGLTKDANLADIDSQPTEEAKPVAEPEAVGTCGSDSSVDISQPVSESKLVEELEVAEAPKKQKGIDEPQPAEEIKSGEEPQATESPKEEEPAAESIPLEEAKLTEELMSVEVPKEDETDKPQATKDNNSVQKSGAGEARKEDRPADASSRAASPEQRLSRRQSRSDTLPIVEPPALEPRREEKIVDDHRSGKVSKPANELQAMKAPKEDTLARGPMQIDKHTSWFLMPSVGSWQLTRISRGRAHEAVAPCDKAEWAPKEEKFEAQPQLAEETKLAEESQTVDTSKGRLAEKSHMANEVKPAKEPEVAEATKNIWGINEPQPTEEAKLINIPVPSEAPKLSPKEEEPAAEPVPVAEAKLTHDRKSVEVPVPMVEKTDKPLVTKENVLFENPQALATFGKDELANASQPSAEAFQAVAPAALDAQREDLPVDEPQFGKAVEPPASMPQIAEAHIEDTPAIELEPSQTEEVEEPREQVPLTTEKASAEPHPMHEAKPSATLLAEDVSAEDKTSADAQRSEKTKFAEYTQGMEPASDEKPACEVHPEKEARPAEWQGAPMEKQPVAEPMEDVTPTEEPFAEDIMKMKAEAEPQLVEGTKLVGNPQALESLEEARLGLRSAGESQAASEAEPAAEPQSAEELEEGKENALLQSTDDAKPADQPQPTEAPKDEKPFELEEEKEIAVLQSTDDAKPADQPQPTEAPKDEKPIDSKVLSEAESLAERKASRMRLARIAKAFKDADAGVASCSAGGPAGLAAALAEELASQAPRHKLGGISSGLAAAVAGIAKTNPLAAADLANATGEVLAAQNENTPMMLYFFLQQSLLKSYIMRQPDKKDK